MILPVVWSDNLETNAVRVKIRTKEEGRPIYIVLCFYIPRI
jgi:hypothetical protein